jgi:hypothetical protein
MFTVEEILEAVKELPPEKKDELKDRLMSLSLLWENLTVNWATPIQCIAINSSLLPAFGIDSIAKGVIQYK